VDTIMISCKEKKNDQPRRNYYVELLIIRNRHPSSSCRELDFVQPKSSCHSFLLLIFHWIYYRHLTCIYSDLPVLWLFMPTSAC
jgi:hypothetical protein